MKPHPKSYRPDLPLKPRRPRKPRLFNFRCNDAFHNHVMSETKKELKRIEKLKKWKPTKIL